MVCRVNRRKKARKRGKIIKHYVLIKNLGSLGKVKPSGYARRAKARKKKDSNRFNSLFRALGRSRHQTTGQHPFVIRRL